MSSFLRLALVTVFLLLSLQTIVLGDDTKPPAINPELAAADQLYRAGKFAEAEAGYQALPKNLSLMVRYASPAGWITFSPELTMDFQSTARFRWERP